MAKTKDYLTKKGILEALLFPAYSPLAVFFILCAQWYLTNFRAFWDYSSLIFSLIFIFLSVYSITYQITPKK